MNAAPDGSIRAAMVAPDVSMNVYPNGTLEAISGSPNSILLGTPNTQQLQIAFTSVQQQLQPQLEPPSDQQLLLLPPQQRQQQQQQGNAALTHGAAAALSTPFRRANVPGSRPYSSGRYATASSAGWPCTGPSQQANKILTSSNLHLRHPPAQQRVPQAMPQTMQQAVVGQVVTFQPSRQYQPLAIPLPAPKLSSTLPQGLILGQRALPLQLCQPQQQLPDSQAQPQHGLPPQQQPFQQQPQQMVSFRSPVASGTQLPAASVSHSSGLYAPVFVAFGPGGNFLTGGAPPMGVRTPGSIPLGTTAAAAAANLPPNWNLVGGPGTRPARMLQAPAPRTDAYSNPQRLAYTGGHYMSPGQLGVQPSALSPSLLRPMMPSQVPGIPLRGPAAGWASHTMCPPAPRPQLMTRTGGRPSTPTVRNPVLQPTTPLSALSPEAIAALLRPQGSSEEASLVPPCHHTHPGTSLREQVSDSVPCLEQHNSRQPRVWYG